MYHLDPDDYALPNLIKFDWNPAARDDDRSLYPLFFKVELTLLNKTFRKNKIIAFVHSTKKVYRLSTPFVVLVKKSFLSKHATFSFSSYLQPSL